MDASTLEALGLLSEDELRQAFTPYELQLQMAEALRRPSGRQHSTGWGAALGGLGDAIGNTAGAYFQKEAGNAMQQDMLARAAALRGTQQRGAGARSAYQTNNQDMDAIRALLQQQQQQGVQPLPWLGVPFELPQY
jgi:hypothetical protein